MDTQVATPQIAFLSSRICLQTTGPRHFFDLTDELQARVASSGVQSGLAVVTSLHTTASLLINEHEPELLKDLDDFLSRLAPEETGYLHNAVPVGPGEQPNGHAHCQALLLQASVTLPIIAGRVSIGRYQRIFLVELDCSRPREVVVSLLGA
jgi:secondary thiamine-phosphate synthase enzyme